MTLHLLPLGTAVACSWQVYFLFFARGVAEEGSLLDGFRDALPFTVLFTLLTWLLLGLWLAAIRGPWLRVALW